MKKKTTLADLFFTMLKIGLFTFGGGYAMIALLRSELVEKKKWIGQEEFLDVVAIAESTPGPIAINCSTYIGYQLGGVLGAAVGTAAICIPSFVIIFLISLFFDAFLANPYVACAFRGIQVCVGYLILSAGCKMIAEMKKDAFHLCILIAVMTAMLLFTFFAVSFSSIWYILICGIIGIAFSLIGRERRKTRK